MLIDPLLSDEAEVRVPVVSFLGVQCLSHVPELTHYFLSDRYHGDVNAGGDDGGLSASYGDLVRLLWSREYRAVSPHDFKRALGERFAQFRGYQQHDAQEFITWFLDGLHEELNRGGGRRAGGDPPGNAEVRSGDEQVLGSHPGPSDRGGQDTEASTAWSEYTARHSSIIVDRFQGQLLQTVTCPRCSHERRTYETFMYLPVSLPPEFRLWRVTVVAEIPVVEALMEHVWRLYRDSGSDPRTRRIIEQAMHDGLLPDAETSATTSANSDRTATAPRACQDCDPCTVVEVCLPLHATVQRLLEQIRARLDLPLHGDAAVELWPARVTDGTFRGWFQESTKLDRHGSASEIVVYAVAPAPTRRVSVRLEEPLSSSDWEDTDGQEREEEESEESDAAASFGLRRRRHPAGDIGSTGSGYPPATRRRRRTRQRVRVRKEWRQESVPTAWIPVEHKLLCWTKNGRLGAALEAGRAPQDDGDADVTFFRRESKSMGVPYMMRVTSAMTAMHLWAVGMEWSRRCCTQRDPREFPANESDSPDPPMDTKDGLVAFSQEPVPDCSPLPARHLWRQRDFVLATQPVSPASSKRTSLASGSPAPTAQTAAASSSTSSSAATSLSSSPLPRSLQHLSVSRDALCAEEEVLGSDGTVSSLRCVPLVARAVIQWGSGSDLVSADAAVEAMTSGTRRAVLHRYDQLRKAAVHQRETVERCGRAAERANLAFQRRCADLKLDPAEIDTLLANEQRCGGCMPANDGVSKDGEGGTSKDGEDETKNAEDGTGDADEALAGYSLRKSQRQAVCRMWRQKQQAEQMLREAERDAPALPGEPSALSVERAVFESLPSCVVPRWTQQIGFRPAFATAPLPPTRLQQLCAEVGLTDATSPGSPSPVRLQDVLDGNATLDQCLTLFTQPHALDGQSGWVCPSCHESVRATLQTRLHRAPDVLLVVLKRFLPLDDFGRTVKNQRNVTFPLTSLDLRRWASGEDTSSRCGNQDSPADLFDLFGVVAHHGTCHGGHYTAHVQHCLSSRWWSLDDDMVREVWRPPHAQAPASEAAGDGCAASAAAMDEVARALPTRDAYVLFFRRRGTGLQAKEHLQPLVFSAGKTEEGESVANGRVEEARGMVESDSDW